MPESQQPQDDADVIFMMNADIAPGQMQIMSCRTCGALTFIRFAGQPGTGDPLGHDEYHRKRGEL
jgi:hypothetical protein